MILKYQEITDKMKTRIEEFKESVLKSGRFLGVALLNEYCWKGIEVDVESISTYVYEYAWMNNLRSGLLSDWGPWQSADYKYSMFAAQG